MSRPAPVERRFGGRDELLEQAAEASRAGLRTRRERIVTGARPILHSAVSAALAWLVATELLGHEQPFFAPIAAVITLGLTVGERRRRAVELAIGVLEATANLSALHIVGQIRLTAVDLLRATGLERERAQEAVRGATVAPAGSIR